MPRAQYQHIILCAVSACLLRLGVVFISADPLTRDEKLTTLDGQWHRRQRDNIDFQASCWYNHNTHNGCRRYEAVEGGELK